MARAESSSVQDVQDALWSWIEDLWREPPPWLDLDIEDRLIEPLPEAADAKPVAVWVVSECAEDDAPGSAAVDRASQAADRAAQVVKEAVAAVGGARLDALLLVYFYNLALKVVWAAHPRLEEARDAYRDARIAVEQKKAEDIGFPTLLEANKALGRRLFDPVKEDRATLDKMTRAHPYLDHYRFDLPEKPQLLTLDACLAEAFDAARSLCPKWSQMQAAQKLGYVVRPLVPDDSPLAASPDALRKRAYRHRKRTRPLFNRPPEH